MLARPLRSMLLLLSIFCGFSVWGQSPRVRQNIDEDWHFALGHAADASKDFNYSIANIFSKSGKAENSAIDPRFNDSLWRRLDLPHDWAVELPFANSPNFDVMAHGYKPVGGLFPATSIGWYRKRFVINAADSGLRHSVTFDGIFRNADIWLNGFYLGRNQSGYVGVTYDITDYIQFGRNNVLVVRVDASQYEGWFYEGAGIYRHVWLNRHANTHLSPDGLFVHTAVQQGSATVHTDVEVYNDGLSGSSFSVESYITDRTGKRLTKTASRTLSVEAGLKKELRLSQVIGSPRLWDLDDPYLYRSVVLLRQNGKVIDSLQTRFGVRTFRFDGQKGFFLNGRHVKIKGTNNHQDHAGVGSALPDYLQYYRIRLLKEMGSNAYRASHHAPTPELLDACDSLGMLVMDEQRLLNSSPEYMDQFERLIRRDRNHPSVFMWSIGNEEGYIQTTGIGKRIAQTLLAMQKRLDPTRTSTYAADVANVFQGVNEVIPVRGFNYRQVGVADYHRDHPGQPIIGTEMGSTVTTRGIYEKDSIRAYVPDQDITAPWWASTAETWWTLAAENDFWMGGFIWTGFDYRGEPTPYQWPNISSHFGVMDMCGFPKNIYYYYQSWWSDKDVLHISPHWNWKGKEGQPIDVWVNSNADSVELLLNGRSLGSKAMPRNRHLNWTVNYAPGRLEAVAKKKGRRFTASVETTGEPFKIVVSGDRRTLNADGKDIAILNISAVDKEGREVPTANMNIRFALNGGGRIIGVGNSDPSSHEADKYADDREWQRRLFNGKCQVIVQAGKAAGSLQFVASGEGLQSATETVRVEKQ